ncbi:MAG: type II secretion system protein [Candidatus Parcubacteria bacterium]|nr:type II secretion system protein [Candidatus Parcubacteria bacterium]
MPNNKKGFTLIELLVVMGILGILMAVTILVINPAEYLARSRDTQRINDLNTISSAMGIYMANNGTITAVTGCRLSALAAVTTVVAFNCGANTSTTYLTTAALARAVDATGWINVAFNSSTYFPGGSPFGSLPLDPTNTGSLYYVYSANSSNQYEIDANTLESTYYKTTQDSDGNDGGNNPLAYEVGTLLTLNDLKN